VPPLLALDAAVELRSRAGTRALPLSDFISGNRRTARREDEIVTAVTVPRTIDAGASTFLKLGARRYLVISIAMVAAVVQADADGRMIRLSGLDVMTTDEGVSALVNPIAAELGSKFNADYGLAYDNLLGAVNAKLNRPLKDGFRMEGNLASARLKGVSLPADGVVIAVYASGELKILYGM